MVWARYTPVTNMARGVFRLARWVTVCRISPGTGSPVRKNSSPMAMAMIALLNRLRAGERVMPMGEEVLAEVDKKALALADRVLEPINRWFGQADDSERILVALHIQSALEE